MTKDDNEKITDAVSEEFIDSEEWKENLLKQGKWLRLLWMIGFSFIYYLSMTVLWIIVLVQFLFVLLTDKKEFERYKKFLEVLEITWFKF